MRKKKAIGRTKATGKSSQPAPPESENRFQKLLENINEGIIVQDKKSIVTYANDRFLQMIGYRQDEVIGRPITALLGKGWLRKDRGDEAGVEKARWKSTEIAWKRKDGKMVFTILSPKPIYDKKGRFSGSVAVLTDISDRRKVEIELRRSHEQLRNLSQHLEFVREKESKRIAGEIHDVLGQQLTSLKIDLSWLTDRILSGEKDSNKIIEKINDMSGLIDQTIQAVQKISAELRPGLLDDLGLLAAIEWLALDFQRKTKIRCRTSFDREEMDLDPNLATVIFRISQEALTNVVRHANATRVIIKLKEEDGGLVLMIKDNGKGIDEKRIWDLSSLGILGMRERARQFSGELMITGTPQKGTMLTAIFPNAID
jgi:two-component system sensor histidine kinase UhpB